MSISINQLKPFIVKAFSISEINYAQILFETQSTYIETNSICSWFYYNLIGVGNWNYYESLLCIKET